MKVTMTVSAYDKYVWSDDEVRHYFDTHWDVTIAQLARMANRTKEDVKKCLNT